MVMNTIEIINSDYQGHSKVVSVCGKSAIKD